MPPRREGGAPRFERKIPKFLLEMGVQADGTVVPDPGAKGSGRKRAAAGDGEDGGPEVVVEDVDGVLDGVASGEKRQRVLDGFREQIKDEDAADRAALPDNADARKHTFRIVPGKVKKRDKGDDAAPVPKRKGLLSFGGGDDDDSDDD